MSGSTQVVRYRQVRRDEAIADDQRRGEQLASEHASAALKGCRDGEHSPIRFSGRRFCVHCGQVNP